MLGLLDAAYAVRWRYFGRTVSLHVIRNAKSGVCGEDYAYCSQSAESRANVPCYPLQREDAESSALNRPLNSRRRAWIATTTISKRPHRGRATRPTISCWKRRAARSPRLPRLDMVVWRHSGRSGQSRTLQMSRRRLFSEVEGRPPCRPLTEIRSREKTMRGLRGAAFPLSQPFPSTGAPKTLCNGGP